VEKTVYGDLKWWEVKKVMQIELISLAVDV
jgi:hypothetical protein